MRGISRILRFSGGPSITSDGMSERILLVDRLDKHIGNGLKYDTHRVSNDLPLHRAFSVFAFDTSGRMMIQQRSRQKNIFPLFWSNTCCSHPNDIASERGDHTSPGEGVKVAASRRLQQELGLDLPPSRLSFLTRVHYGQPFDQTWGEHEIDHLLFALCSPQELKGSPDPAEVENIEFVGPVAFDGLATKGKLTVNGHMKEGLATTPWVKLMTRSDLLFKWWGSYVAAHSDAPLPPSLAPVQPLPQTGARVKREDAIALLEEVDFVLGEANRGDALGDEGRGCEVPIVETLEGELVPPPKVPMSHLTSWEEIQRVRGGQILRMGEYAKGYKGQ